MNERKGKVREMEEERDSVATYRNRRSVRRCIVMLSSTSHRISLYTSGYIRCVIPPLFPTTLFHTSRLHRHDCAFRFMSFDRMHLSCPAIVTLSLSTSWFHSMYFPVDFGHSLKKCLLFLNRFDF